MLTIRQIFLYLDRTYVISTSAVRSLFEMGLQLFGGHLARHPEVLHLCACFVCNCDRYSCAPVEVSDPLLSVTWPFA